jgi:hypothetical protein
VFLSCQPALYAPPSATMSHHLQPFTEEDTKFMIGSRQSVPSMDL